MSVLRACKTCPGPTHNPGGYLDDPHPKTRQMRIFSDLASCVCVCDLCNINKERSILCDLAWHFLGGNKVVAAHCIPAVYCSSPGGGAFSVTAASSPTRATVRLAGASTSPASTP